MKFLIRALVALTILGEITFVVLIAQNPELPRLLGLLALIPLAFAIAIMGYLLISKARATTWSQAIREVSTELGVPRRALRMWGTEVAYMHSLMRRRPKGEDYFGAHSPLTPVVWIFGFLSIVEATLVHLLVPIVWLRWVILILSAYAMLVFIGFYRSLSTNPHRIRGNTVDINSGVRCRIHTSVENIAHAGRCMPGEGGSVTLKEGTLRIPVLSQVNTVVEFKEEVPIEDMVLGTPPIKKVEFYVDNRDEFLKKLGAA